MSFGVVVAAEDGGQSAQFECDRPVGANIAEHRVARRIGCEQPIKDLGVLRVAKSAQTSARTNIDGNPAPVARHQAKLALGQPVEFDAGVVWPPQLQQRQLQPAPGEYDQGILCDESSQRRLEVAKATALPGDQAALNYVRVERQRTAALLPRREGLLR